MRAVHAIFAAVAVAAVAAKGRKWDTTFKGYSDDKLNVHLVSHTHDDVGWLKTLDEYYVGANNSIQHAAVRYILDSVVTELPKNPDRKFIYVEQAFFQHWWFEQDEDTRDTVRQLLASGQLTFTNAGWDMHDEANPTYIDMIDQTTLGNRFLLQELGNVPKATWQIDPFGHSAAQQSLLTALAGYDAMYVARIDYQDKLERAATKRLETVWRASPSLGAAAQSFFGTLYYHYCPPPGLNFDVSNDGATPVTTDPRLEGITPTAAQIVETFIADATQQAEMYRDGHIMFTMGCDFQYEQADEWYSNLDALIHLLNADGRVNVFYSTPDQYTQARHAQGGKWPLKTDDFFPYADAPWAYWTGYFTSRPALKGYVRDESAYLQAARTLLVAANATGLATPTLSPAQAAKAPSARDQVRGDGSTPEWFTTAVSHLEHAVGTLQHHDAVAGTEQQHVAFDYAKKLSRGHAAAQAGTDEVLTHLTGGATDWAECTLANVTLCAATAKGLPTVMAIVNQQAQTRLLNVHIPVGMPAGVKSWAVANSSTGAVRAQIVPFSPRDLSLRRVNGGDTAAGGAWLNFQVSLPAYGYTTVFLTPASTGHDAPATSLPDTVPRRAAALSISPAALRGAAATDASLNNGAVTVGLSGATGQVSSITNHLSNVTAAVAPSWHWYNSSAGNTCPEGNCQSGFTQASGAYIFRPNTSTPFPVNAGAATFTVTAAGPVVWEAQHVVGEWVTAVTRLWAGQSGVEVEWTVGPIPIADGLGKEVIHRLDTDLLSGEEWATDSNGRDMIPRRRDYRPTWKLNLTEPVSANYVPVNAALQLSDGTRALAIVNDRSQGGASLASGSAELMVHRRMLHDDGRGVGQALDEPGLTGQGLIVRGKHTILLESPSTIAAAQRGAMQDDFFRPMVKYGPTGGLTPGQWGTKFSPARAGVAAPLPPNVHLLTADSANYGAGTMLVRLAHLYAIGEDPVLSQPATVGLAGLFQGLTITAATETTLRANEDLASYSPLQWETEDGAAPQNILQRWAASPPSGGDLEVTLGPMEIRTFLVTFTPSNA